MTTEQLLALLTPANKETAMTIAAKLSKASEAIQDIADDLKLRVPLVKWEGEGGDAFKDWANETANATLRLGEYAKGAGKWMTDVAQAIAEAQSGLDELKKSASAAQSDYGDAKKTHNAAVHDPGAGKDAAKDAKSDMDLARAGMEAARLASVDRLRKLGETYTQSGEQINRLEPPTFPPPAQLNGRWRDMEGERGYRQSARTSRSVGTTDRARSRSASDSPETRATQGRTQAEGNSPASAVSVSRPEQQVGQIAPPAVVPSVSPVPDRPVGMGIDSVATPEAPVTAPGPGVLPPGGRPDGVGNVPPAVVPPGVIPPAFGGGGGGTKSAPFARGVGPGGGGAVPRLPMARADGIVGGRPVSPTTGPSAGRPAGALPRGTVIGGEGTTGTRGQMGRGMAGMPGGMHGGPMGGTGQSGISGGRRLASETGGVVGGRPQQPGQASGRPFTPGGSGLVRGGSADQAGRTGMAGAGTNRPHPRREDEDGERPDYLVEEEETWQQGSRRVVPPVID
ncbi:WXG100 family type VII secretion target [Streptomyces sp. NPDC055078]